MTINEDRLRAALRQTGEQVPPGAIPPLELPADHPGRAFNGQRPIGPRRWPAAVAVAAAVCLIVGLAVTLAGRPRPVAPNTQTRPTGQLSQFPPYYVALQQTGGGNYSTNPDHAVVLSTSTGSTLATISVPKPYGTFAFVQGTADDRDFILGAQQLSAGPPVAPYPATKLYLLRLNPSARPGQLAQLTAMAAPTLRPARGYELVWLALSPNGQQLAAISTTTSNGESTQLRVYDLVTGASRTWMLPRWAGRLDTYSDVAGPPSWKADSRTLAFFDRAAAGSAELVLLDTAAAAASFGADTTTVRLPRPQGTDEVIFGPDSPLLTPDGQHVLEEVINQRELNARPLNAFALEVVNLRTGTVRLLRQRSQMLFALASDPSGSAVIEAEGNLPPLAQGILAWTAHRITAIEVPPHTIAVAW